MKTTFPFEITVRSKVLCGSKKHRHVSVVTAGVHKARLTRFPRAFACFRDRKRIHVWSAGPQCVLARASSSKNAHDPMAADAFESPQSRSSSISRRPDLPSTVFQARAQGVHGRYGATQCTQVRELQVLREET